VLHRAAILAERAGAAQDPAPRPADHVQTATWAESLHAQLDLLIPDAAVRDRIEVLKRGPAAYRVVKQARGSWSSPTSGSCEFRWAQAAADAGLDLTPAFLKNEWEAGHPGPGPARRAGLLTCLRHGRGRPLHQGPAQPGCWHALPSRSRTELAAKPGSPPLQLANEATQLLRQPGAPRLPAHPGGRGPGLAPGQWRLLPRRPSIPAPTTCFIAAETRTSASTAISVALASQRISVGAEPPPVADYRTTQEILGLGAAAAPAPTR